MSLPTVFEVRQRIETVENEALRYCLMATFLWCCRIDEVASLTHPTDNYGKAKAYGNMINVQTVTFTPDISKEEQTKPFMIRALMENKPLTLQDIARIQEPVALFTVANLKHGHVEDPARRTISVKTKTVALPLNPDYEPWTKPLMEYVWARKREGVAVFPFTRVDMWKFARKLFRGWQYRIDAYTVGAKPNLVEVPEHLKPFGNHALRHLRTEDLEDNYGFTDRDLDSYGGWIATEGSKAKRRYRTGHWENYLPKLLKKRNSV